MYFVAHLVEVRVPPFKAVPSVKRRIVGFQVTERKMAASYIKAYGSHRSEPKGWITQLGEEQYSHRFGGES